MWIVESKNGATGMLPAKLLTAVQLKTASSPLAWKILQLLANKPNYPKEIGKKLKVHEQKIYYHIRRLEAAGLVEKIHSEARQGAMANFYTITKPAFALALKQLEPATKIGTVPLSHSQYLEPFIKNGRLDALIIIGSPEPHGPSNVVGHDGMYATDLALFLGTFLNHIPSSSIKLDTEVTEADLKKNLIVIGGPAVNSITAKLNPKLPIRFVRVSVKNNYFTRIHSMVSGKNYSNESYAIVEKAKNPFNSESSVLVIAGRRFYGTKAGVLAFLQKFDELCKGNSYNQKITARVINSIDMDSDGEIDTVEFLE